CSSYIKVFCGISWFDAALRSGARPPVALMCHGPELCIHPQRRGSAFRGSSLRSSIACLRPEQGVGAVKRTRIEGHLGGWCRAGSRVYGMSRRGLRTLMRGIAGCAIGGVVGAIALAGACSTASADTLEWALVQAYQNNPSLNAQRASLRATDENVPQALSGYRPKLSLTATGGYNYQNSTSVFPLGGVLVTSPFAQNFYSRTIGATGTYTLFNGFQAANRTRQAESQVDAACETLRVTEQQVLLDSATAY